MEKIDKYNHIVKKYSKLLIKKSKSKIRNDVNFINGLAIFLSLIAFIWMFIMLLVIPNSNLSTSYLNATAFYSAKLSSDLSSYSLSLTTNGIVFIVFLILLIGFIIFAFINTKNNIRKIKPYKYRLISLIVFIFYSLVFVLFLIFILIPPKVNEVQDQIYLTDQIRSYISYLNSTPNLNIQLPNGLSSLSEAISKLASYIPANNIKYTIFSTSSNAFVYFNSSINAIYVLFALPMFFVLFSFLFKLFYVNKSYIAPAITKENIKLIIAAYKQNKKEKKQLKKNKKKLIEEENKLLQNLYEVDVPNNDNLTKKQVSISQAELEAKVNENNEMKKKLEELVKQKEELKKESLKKSKFKSFINKLQENNISKSKNKKQEIAIPDQELEEIFKSLDIE